MCDAAFILTAAVTAVVRASYSEEQQLAGQRVMVAEGLFSRAMEGVTGGVILAAFALTLGASDFAIGVIAAIPFLAQLAHLPAVGLLARYRDRRPLAVGAGVAARAILLLIAAVALFDLPVPKLPAVIALLVAYAVVSTLSGAAWQVWIRDLVPRHRLGAYFGRRMGILAGVGLVTLLAAGQFLSWWTARRPERILDGFGLLFVVGGVLGFTSSVILSRAPSLRADEPATPASVRASLARPFGERNYRRVLVFLAAWGFSANVALPFVSVVLLTTLGYGFEAVTALAALSLLANAVGFIAWAPLTDRFGNKPILFLSSTLFLVAMAAWAVLPKEPGLMILAAAAALHVVLGLATSGLDLASNGVVLKLAPDAEAPAYLASASLVRAVSTGVAPLVGGAAAALLAGRAFAVRVAWTHPGGEAVANVIRFAHYDFLFIASAVLGLYAVHRLLGFEEEGEAPPDAVVRAMRREVSQISSVAGMRQFAHVGSYMTELASSIERGLRSGKRPRAKRIETPRDGPPP